MTVEASDQAVVANEKTVMFPDCAHTSLRSAPKAKAELHDIKQSMKKKSASPILIS